MSKNLKPETEEKLRILDLKYFIKLFEFHIYRIADKNRSTKNFIVDQLLYALGNLYKNEPLSRKLWEDKYEIILEQAKKCKDLKDVIKKKQEALDSLIEDIKKIKQSTLISEEQASEQEFNKKQADKQTQIQRIQRIKSPEGIKDLLFGKKPRRKSPRGAHSRTKRKRSTRRRSTRRRHRRSVRRSVRH